MYGFFHWTPEVFWKMSFPEYIAVARAGAAIMAAQNEGYKQSANKRNGDALTKDDVSRLKAVLNVEKEKNKND